MNKRLLDVLACPVTKGRLIERGNELWSLQAALAFPIIDGRPCLLQSAARELELHEVEQARQSANLPYRR